MLVGAVMGVAAGPVLGGVFPRLGGALPVDAAVGSVVVVEVAEGVEVGLEPVEGGRVGGYDG